MKCPHDHATLNATIYEADIEVDACPTCRGMWLDAGELEEILETIENDYSKELAQEPDDVRSAYRQVRPTHSGPLKCPKCESEMFAKEYAYCSQIIIDVCPDGCGVWLEDGEIQELEKFFERTQKSVREDDAKRAKRGMWSSLMSMLKR